MRDYSSNGYYDFYYGSYFSNEYGVIDYAYYDSFYDAYYGDNYSQDAFSYQFVVDAKDNEDGWHPWAGEI